VEEDGMMTADSELVPFGISMTKGDSSIIPASRGSSSACSDPDSFKVAIIDSGVEVGHPDIPCRPVADPDTNCKGISIGIDDLWYAPTGKAGHGTHVFGTIGAVGGNDKGVAGMVPDSDGICYLIARVFDDEGKGGFASSTFEAVDWAVSEGANIINMSLGSATYYQAGQAAITSAHALGALTVSSAGNSGTKSLQYPASFDDAISVAAVNTDGTRASFSQYNAKVDIAAPGVRVLSTYLDGGYTAMSGTSMAVPHVTGAIAKVWSVCRQCSNVQVESCLLNAASNASRRTNELGFGIVNADDTYDCLVNTGGCCAEAKEAEQEPVQAVPEPVQAVPEPVPRPAPEPVPEPAQEPAQEAAQALVQALVQAPVQAVPRVPYCPRRDTGEKCRRDAHCCSGKCAGSWPDMTCQAVFGL
jgi:serine protease